MSNPLPLPKFVFIGNGTRIKSELIIGMLRKDPNKIPSPSQDDIMKMLSDAWNSLDLDVAEALKQIS